MGTRSQAGNRKGKKGGSSSNNSTLSVMTAGDQKEVIERLERKEREVRELQQKLKMKEQLNAFSEIGESRRREASFSSDAARQNGNAPGQGRSPEHSG